MQDRPSELSTRPVNAADDEAFLFALYASTRDDLAVDAGVLSSVLRMQYTAQAKAYSAEYPSAEHSLIISGTTPVGRMMVARNGGQTMLIDISILQDFRGRGIGGRMIRKLLDEAEAANSTVVLHVLKTNRRALELYARLGFAVAYQDAVRFRMEWTSPGASKQNWSAKIPQ
jgi:ribosomal protein S18 acetylase RimI-like enzyme